MSGLIPKDFIDDLVLRTDIVDLIDHKVPLKKAGKNYQACCPFHNEKSPSFSVNPENQFYHCFGCGVSGNAISFIMEFEQLEFVEAIEELARLHNLEVPREAYNKNSSYQSTTEKVSSVQKQSDYELMSKVSKYFQHQLKHNEKAQTAIDYLKSRGLSGEIAQRYGIGYAPDAWNSVLNDLGQSKVQAQQLLDLKILNQNEKGRIYDFFRHRIVFPINDKRGRILGFGGRVLDDAVPKYLNSPETRIFHKGKELYGLYQVKQANPQPERIIIVEGYMDVVSLAQHGVDYAVAALGTATTSDHMRMLFRTSRQIICCYDGDRAGKDAAWRALENALPHIKDGVELRFVFLPDGEDPDTMIQTEGKAAFEERINNAMTLTDYFFSHLSSSLDLASDGGKSALLSQSKPLIEVIPSEYYQQLLIEKLTQLVGTSSKRFITSNASPIQKIKYKQTELTITPMRRAIALLLQQPELAHCISYIPELREAEVPGFKTFIDIQNIALENSEITGAAILERFREKKEYSLLCQLVIWQHQIQDDNLEQEFQHTFKALQNQYLEQRLNALSQKSKTSQLSPYERQQYVSLMSALKA